MYAIWGTSYVSIKVGVSHIPPFLFCGVRYLVAAFLLLIIARLRREQRPQTLRDGFWLVTTAVLIQVLPGGLIAWAQQFISSQMAALLMSSSCLWIVLLGSIGPHGHRLTPLPGAGLLLGTISLLLLTELKTDGSPALSYLAVLLAALLFSLGTLLFRRFVSNQQMATSAAIHLVFSGSLILAFSQLTEAPAQWHPDGVMALFYLAVVNSVIALLLYYWLVHNASPALISTPNMVVPAVAILAGTLLADEVLSYQQTIGAALMLIALLLILVPKTRFPAIKRWLDSIKPS